MYIYAGDSNENEHKEKNDGDSDHGILTGNKSGSKSCKGETSATVLQVRVSHTGVPKVNEYPKNGSWIGIDSCGAASVSGLKSDFAIGIEMGTGRIKRTQIEGICGAVRVKGSGTIATAVQAFKSNGTNGMSV